MKFNVNKYEHIIFVCFCALLMVIGTVILLEHNTVNEKKITIDNCSFRNGDVVVMDNGYIRTAMRDDMCDTVGFVIDAEKGEILLKWK